MTNSMYVDYLNSKRHGKASIHGQMVTNTMGNGRMVLSMEKESGCIQMVVEEGTFKNGKEDEIIIKTFPDGT